MKRLTLVRRCLRLLGENQMLRHRVGLLEQQNDVLATQLQQARRDCDLLALMCPDRAVALGFVRDAHQIGRLEEAD